jgi:predicted Zn-dependent protease
MSRLPRHTLFVIAGCLAAAWCCGCVTTKPPTLVKGNVPPLNPARKAEVVTQFETQRDQAQLQAAMNRWKEGNITACERALAILVERRPEFVDARVQYAELLIAKENPAAAEHQLRTALRLAPERADIHHSLAMALNAGGNSAEAAGHFRKAAELEPESPVYQMALDGL